MKYRYLLFLFYLMLCANIKVNAQISWTGAVDSLWHNPLNWNPQIVPDSADNVNIILDTSSPQPHWPHLQQAARVNRIEIRNAELNLNDQIINCNRLLCFFSQIFTGIDTGRIEFYQGTSVVFAGFTETEIQGDLLVFGVNGSTIDFNKTTTDGIKIILGTDNSVVTIDFNSHFRGDLTILGPRTAGVSGIPQGNIIEISSATIDGDLIVINQMAGATHFGNLPSPTDRPRPALVRVYGKFYVDHNSPPNFPNNYLSLFRLNRVKHHTPGGGLNVSGNTGVTLQLDSLNVDSININLSRGKVYIDSCEIFSPEMRFLSNFYEGAYPQSLIGGSKFYGNFYLTDTSNEIQETMGFDRSPYHNPGSSNYYYGNAYFKGKVKLGMVDTSEFHGNLTIEALDGSVYKRARFSGDGASEVNVGDTPFEYAIVDKSSAGSVKITSPLNISGVMRFDNGKAYTNPGSYVKFLNTAVAEEVNEHKYIVGKVMKEGNQPFVFPTGSEDQFKPFTMSAPADSTEGVAVHYHASSVQAVSDTSNRVAGLPDISNCEYWEVEQVNGTSTLSLAAAWDEGCLDDTVYYTDPQQSHMAFWDGTMWQDAGNGGYSNGFIATSGAFTPNGLFTFATPRKVVPVPEPPTVPELVIYPNPVPHTLNINLPAGYTKGIIYDAIGRRISVHTLYTGLNTIEVRQLPVGVYFLKLITGRHHRTLKWVKAMDN